MNAQSSRPTVQELVPPATWPRMRPRFIVELDCTADRVMDALREGAARDADLIEGKFSERNAVMTLPEVALRFWSTRLGITVDDPRDPTGDGVGPTRVLGIFEPRPDIWLVFVFAIGILLLIGVFGVMVAIVQLTMGHSPWGLFASLLAALVGGLVYLSTLVGQSLALGEMYHLRRRLDDYLDDAREADEAEPRTAADSAQL